MKKYVRTATDRANKATQTVSKKFSQEELAQRSHGSRKGESMAQIFHNITHDPDVEIGEADEEGNSTIFYKGENAGWINFKRQMGSINNKKYTQIKHAAKARVAQDSTSDDEDEE